MNRQFLIKCYTWAIKGLMLAIPLFSLYVPTSMFFPYITGRNFAFRILVELALALWVGLMFLRKEYRPRPSLILMAVLAFGLIVGAADLLGVDPYHSFWSRYERMEGYVMILHLIAYGLMLTTVFRTKKDWKFLFNVFIGVGLIVGFYGILQKLGYRPALQGGARIDGTIGNPTYLAAYLLLISFLTLALFFEVKAKWAKWLYGAILAYFIFIIFLTASRGPILAIVLSAFLIPLCYLIFARKQDPKQKFHSKIAISAIVILVLAPTVFWLIKNSDFIQTNYIFKRFADISLTEKTTRSRFMIWNMSWQGFKERPILGWGQENYTTVFAKYYNPRLYDQEPWFDRSHNIIFDWLINAGALGLLSYLSIFIVFFMTLWKLFQKGVMSATPAIVFFAAMIAYFFQNLFVFDNFNTYILFFGILAYVNSLENDSTSAPPPRPPESGTVKTGGLSTPVIATAAALAVSLAVSYFVNLRPIKESLSLINILVSLGKSSPNRVLELFRGTLAYQTFGDTEAREQFGRLATELIASENIPVAEKTVFIRVAAEELEKHVERFPLDVRMRMTLATLYNRAASLDAAYVAKARPRIDEVLRLGPNRQQAHFASAENYLLTNQFDKAVVALENAVNLEPNFVDAQENLGMVAAFAGRDDIVQQAVDKIKARGPANGAPFVRIATAYLKTQKLAKAMEIYKIAVEVEPVNAEYHANLAALYLENGFKQEAIAEAKKAAELDPANYSQKAEDFLKQVK